MIYTHTDLAMRIGMDQSINKWEQNQKLNLKKKNFKSREYALKLIS